jgi:hypothetical protein
VGLHFRCGDHNFLSPEGFEGYNASCVWDPLNKAPQYLSTFNLGSPVQIADCARKNLPKGYS